ncbi:agglutinin biogenesis protein MshI [Oxalobacteraceae bacterium OM1]|nr:agglutinin biogenesis protein MshI [Oxalobacteraceae bacterium OM1]
MRLFKKASKKNGWLAVCLGADGVYAIHAERDANNAKPVIRLATAFPLSGDTQSAALERFCKEIHPERYQCTTALGNGEYQLLSVDAPNVPPDELKTAMRWRLKDLLDYHVDDATIDVLDVPGDKSAPSRNHSMYAVAARNQIIQQRQELFSSAGIPISVIDIPEMAQRNISALLQEEGRGVACLSFDADGGLLTVTFAGDLYLSRRLDLGSAQLSGGTDEQMTARYDRITLELQRSLDHFERQYPFITVGKLLLAPAGDRSEGLRQYLGSNLYVPVQALDMDAVLDLSAVPQLRNPDMQQRWFMAIGCALRHEEKVL